MERLVKLGVLNRQPTLEWAASIFIIPKNKSVHFDSNFREGNKRIMRFPHPIPKILIILQEMEVFKYASAIKDETYPTTVSKSAAEQCIDSHSKR